MPTNHMAEPRPQLPYLRVAPGTEAEPAQDADVKLLRRDLAHDRALLHDLLAQREQLLHELDATRRRLQVNADERRELLRLLNHLFAEHASDF